MRAVPPRVDVLVLGGGLAGLSAAYHIRKASGFSVLVLERGSRVGGASGSRSRGGFVFDHSGHLLHLHDPYGKKLVLDLLGGNVAVLERSAWIHMQGRYTRYPFQANTYGLPLPMVADCLAGYLRTVYRPAPPPPPGRSESFADWSLRQFGVGICRHFMYPYNRKLWGVPLADLTVEWQGRFVPRPRPAEVLCGALQDQKKGFGYNASFRYPKRGGSQVLADALAARLAPGEVALDCAVGAVDLQRRIARIPGRGEVRFARLVNTLPLPEFLDMSGPWPAEVRAARRRLRHNGVWCLNLGVDRPEKTGRHWVYFPESRYPFYRAGCYNNFSRASAPPGTTALYVEVSRRGALSRGLPALERSVLAGLRACGWLGGRDRVLVKEWVSMPYGYVIYDFNRTPALRVIARHLERAGVESIGRYGAWKYSFMEEALLDGKACAERLAGRRADGIRSEAELKPI